MRAQPERNAEIVRLVDSGLTFGQVALSIGVSRNTVAGVVFRSKNPRPRKGLCRGEKHPFAKLTAADVRDIRRRRAGRVKGVALAREYGVDASLICRIANGKAWGHVA